MRDVMIYLITLLCFLLIFAVATLADYITGGGNWLEWMCYTMICSSWFEQCFNDIEGKLK